MIDIGRRIQELRKQKGLSQRALAEAAGISPAALSQIEAGSSSPSVATLEKLADALGVGIAALFYAAKETEELEVVSLDERPSVEIRGGGCFIPLTSLARPIGFEPMFVRLAPGGRFDEAQYGIQSALVFVWVRKAQAMLDYGERSYTLKETQSVYYDARKPHNWRNPFSEPCELLMVRAR